MSEKDKDYFPELQKFKESGHSLVTAMNMASKSLVDFGKERDRLLAETEKLKKEHAELESEMQCYAEGADDDHNIYEHVNHPTHYNVYSVEVIDMMERIYGAESTALWCEMTALKYRMRMGTKPDNSIEQDLAKERWYLNKAQELRK